MEGKQLFNYEDSENKNNYTNAIQCDLQYVYR